MLRILKKILTRQVMSQGQSVDFDQILTFYKIREEKGEKYYKNKFLETREKMENFDIKFMTFREELDLL